jgi:hypothetical protein
LALVLTLKILHLGSNRAQKAIHLLTAKTQAPLQTFLVLDKETLSRDQGSLNLAKMRKTLAIRLSIGNIIRMEITLLEKKRNDCESKNHFIYFYITPGTNSDDRCDLYHFFVSDRFLLKSIFLTVLKASVGFCSCI